MLRLNNLKSCDETHFSLISDLQRVQAQLKRAHYSIWILNFSPPTWVKIRKKLKPGIASKQLWKTGCLCNRTFVFHSWIPAQKVFATEQVLFWKVRSYPNQGQTAKSETFPHTVLSFSRNNTQHFLTLQTAATMYYSHSSGRSTSPWAFPFWVEEHCTAKCCPLETYTLCEVSSCQLEIIKKMK